MQAQPLGQILAIRGLINETQLAKALLTQQHKGGRLGDILVSEGSIGYYELYQAVAEHYRLSFANLLKEAPDPDLCEPLLAGEYLKMRLIPWKKEDGRVIVAIAEIHDENLAWCKARYGDNVRFACTSPFDIRRAVESLFSSEMEIRSRLLLWQRAPHSSARHTFSATQKLALQCFVMASLIGLVAFPLQTALLFIAGCHVAYAATMLFKAFLFSASAACPTAWDWDDRLKSLDEKSLPVYTILIPMYQETTSIAKMLECMRGMDYPAAKLDIKLVLESDDRETLAAAYTLKPSYNFDIIRVPPGNPRTKPRACNYALQFARGEMVTIYDADDQPDALQLKKAVIAFRSLPPDVACLQARLNYFNVNDNLLTRFFSLEYSILFHFMLYGLQRLNMPIPLGGTSNHISLARLKELGEWDPYNVTEDADLGARLSARKLKTVMFDSYTMEEAPNTMMGWIRQRSRWIKGYMQTWLVHMRDPVAFYRAVGFKGFVGFQFFVGLSCFTFLSAPVVWALSILWIGQVAHWHSVTLPEWLIWLTGINLLLNVLTHWYQALYAAWHYRKHKLAVYIAALLYPFYLALHSIASYRALWQLFVKPHFWEKTAHGLARTFDALPAYAQKTVPKSRA